VFIRLLLKSTIVIASACIVITAVNAHGQDEPAVPPPPRAYPNPQPTSPSSTTPSQQTSGDDQAGVFVFKKEVQEVILHATVVDDQRRLVTDLDRSAFSVYEDGALEAITSFHRDEIPVVMGILIDNSGSMREKRDTINQAVMKLIRASNPSDETFVVNFSSDSYLDQDFTSNLDLLQDALKRVSIKGSTALYDAVVASDVHLKNNPRLERKILLVITDGRDNASIETLQQAARHLEQQNGPTLYAIGLLGDDLQESDTGALKSLAQSTGGVAFFPRTLDEVNDIARSIARDIRSQYTIGYKPSNPRGDIGYRTIRVEARTQGHRQLMVRTRSGYYPGETLR